MTSQEVHDTGNMKKTTVFGSENNSMEVSTSSENSVSRTEEQIESIMHYPALRRSSRKEKFIARFTPDCATALLLQGMLGNEDSNTPCSFDEAVKGEEREMG